MDFATGALTLIVGGFALGGGNEGGPMIYSERPAGCTVETAQGFYVRTVFGRENGALCGFTAVYGEDAPVAVLPELEEEATE